MRAVILIVQLILRLLEVLLVLRALLSWFPVSPSNPLRQFLFETTEPFLMPIRTLLYRIPAIRQLPVDLSFIAAFLIIQLLGTLL